MVPSPIVQECHADYMFMGGRNYVKEQILYPKEFQKKSLDTTYRSPCAS